MPCADVAVLNFHGKKVYLACRCTNMRKSLNGLVAIVEASFKLDVFDGALFVFCNRTRDRVKILVWGGDGFWLYFKRLERDRLRWPNTSSGNIMNLLGEELHLLLDNPGAIQKLKRQEVKIGAAA